MGIRTYCFGSDLCLKVSLFKDVCICLPNLRFSPGGLRDFARHSLASRPATAALLDFARWDPKDAESVRSLWIFGQGWTFLGGKMWKKSGQKCRFFVSMAILVENDSSSTDHVVFLTWDLLLDTGYIVCNVCRLIVKSIIRKAKSFDHRLSWGLKLKMVPKKRNLWSNLKHFWRSFKDIVISDMIWKIKFCFCLLINLGWYLYFWSSMKKNKKKLFFPAPLAARLWYLPLAHLAHKGSLESAPVVRPV